MANAFRKDIFHHLTIILNENNTIEKKFPVRQFFDFIIQSQLHYRYRFTL